jgi:pimeloyl-ACP methyl ester carboxylesterase
MPDGRGLAFEEYGDPHGEPVLSFHGGLSSRLDAAPAHAAALTLGVRIISPDRPGMGWSTFQPGRRLLDWPTDVAALADALNIERFAVMGWSCGGPYAAVCAAKMPDRITAVALLASAVPFELMGTTKGLLRSDRILLSLVRRAPRLASVLLRVSIADASEKRLFREIRRSFPAVDWAALKERGSVGEAVGFVKESMRCGTAGCLQDYRIFGDPWGFSLGELTAPVHVWEGAEDHTGPLAYRDLLLRHIPHARLSLVPGEGHLSLLQHQATAILADLTAR